MFKNVSVIGDGAMGTVLSGLLCEKDIPVRMWGYDSEYLAEMEKMGQVSVATEDGSAGYHGLLPGLLAHTLEAHQPGEAVFLNCGPEILLKKLDQIEKIYAAPSHIFHLVERMTKCGIGICGSCALPNGERLCVDGPWFEALRFSPGAYRRSSAGSKIAFDLHSTLPTGGNG